MRDPYIAAGYAAQCGCNRGAALEYVHHTTGCVAFFNGNERIWIEMEGINVPTDYYWEDGTLYTKFATS